MKLRKRNIWIFSIFLIAVVLLYIVLPSQIAIEKELTFTYQYFPSLRMLERQQVDFPERGALKLIKRGESKLVFSTSAPQQIGIVLVCTPQGSSREENDTTRESQRIHFSCMAICDPLAKWMLWVKYFQLKKSMDTYLERFAALGTDAKQTYGLDARVEPCEDSVAYTRYVPLDDPKVSKFEMIQSAFRATATLANQYQAFPGSFSLYVEPQKMMYAWICSSPNIRFSNYTPKHILAGGWLYATDKMNIPLDSLESYQERAIQLTVDRGFTIVAVPFTKVYNLLPESKAIVARIFVPVQ